MSPRLRYPLALPEEWNLSKSVTTVNAHCCDVDLHFSYKKTDWKSKSCDAIVDRECPPLDVFFFLAAFSDSLQLFDSRCFKSLFLHSRLA